MHTNHVLLAFYTTLSLIYQHGTKAEDCTWCDLDLSSCDITDDSDWTLVRAVGSSYAKWHPATDHALGTDAAYDNNLDTYNIGVFSDVVPSFNQYLFITGDCSMWLIASKEAVNGEYTSNDGTLRDICASSESSEAYQAIWLNRDWVDDDPWISTVDHDSAIYAGKIIHGANGAELYTTTVTQKNGAYVFIRYAGELDAQGCADQCLTLDCDDTDECTSDSCDTDLGCLYEDVVCDDDDLVCVDGECQRDCDIFAMDEFLTDCSVGFTTNVDNIHVLQTDVDELGARITSGESRLDDIEGEVEDVNEAIAAMQIVLDKFDAETEAVNILENHDDLGGDEGFVYKYLSTENKDALIIFLLVLNMFTMGGGCIACMKSQRKYEQCDNIRTYETSDID